MSRPQSPALIRANAVRAMDKHRQRESARRVLPVRTPLPEETPLSPDEVAFGCARGLIASSGDIGRRA